MSPTQAVVVAAVAVGVLVLLPGGKVAWRAQDLAWEERSRRWGHTFGGVPPWTVWTLLVATAALVGLASVAGVAGLLTSVAVVGVGVIGPELWFEERERRDRDALGRALPGFLRAWAAALDAGQSPVRAFAEAGREVGEPLRLQVRRVVLFQALRVGTLADGVAERAEALACPPLAELAALLRAGERTGSPLASSARQLAADLDARLAHGDQVAAGLRGPQKELSSLAVLSLGLGAGLPVLLPKLAPPGVTAPTLTPGAWAALGGGALFPLLVLVRERTRAVGG